MSDGVADHSLGELALRRIRFQRLGVDRSLGNLGEHAQLFRKSCGVLLAFRRANTRHIEALLGVSTFVKHRLHRLELHFLVSVLLIEDAWRQRHSPTLWMKASRGTLVFDGIPTK